MPAKNIGDMVYEKYAAVKKWGRGLAERYATPKKDSKPTKKQFEDMFNPKESVFAEAFMNKFKNKKK